MHRLRLLDGAQISAQSGIFSPEEYWKVVNHFIDRPNFNETTPQANSNATIRDIPQTYHGIIRCLKSRETRL